MAERVEHPSPILEDGEFGPHMFELWLIQTNDIKMYTCPIQTVGIIRIGKDWLIQCQDSDGVGYQSAHGAGVLVSQLHGNIKLP